jgi:twitching motility protein PilT
LILVTGKTGSGKSTTLASMVDVINTSQKGHILTIEDPIEFEHQRKDCLVSQREVNNHTKSFSQALHSALREDPDVILVGELRDLETMGLAVTAAETGILVLATLHTNSAAATIDRVINTFPVNKQPQIRTMLSTSLKAIVSQQLVKKADGKGRVAAVEILINTSACSNILREGKSEQLQNIIQSGGAHGMQSMDSSLHNLVQQQMIQPQTAFEAANDKGSFTQYLKKST